MVGPQSDLLDVLQNLLDKGQRPSQIEHWIKQRIPADSPLADYMYLLACYLLSSRFSKN